MTAQTRQSRHWWLVAVTLFAVAWGGNEFTPLLVMYRSVDGLSSMTVNVLLAAYVLGIVPALLLGGPMSDRWGRRPLMLPAPVLGIIGSSLLAIGHQDPIVLLIGRIFSGLALGLVMAVGTAWVKELSSAPFDIVADESAGARRASISLTAGFGLGAAVAAAVAQFGPLQFVTPYLVNIAITVVAGILLLGAAETLPAHSNHRRLVDDLKFPASRHRRFLFVIVPMAPWVFGTAASAYAILPGLVMVRVSGLEIGFSGMMCLLALGCGIAIQTFGRRIDHAGSARAVIVALALTVLGMILAMFAAHSLSIVLSFAAAAVLGSAYGLLLVAGLQEIQRLAPRDELAGLTAVYYSLTYIGFIVPAVLSGLNAWLSYPVMFAAGAVICTLCLALTVVMSRRHLPGY